MWVDLGRRLEDRPREVLDMRPDDGYDASRKPLDGCRRNLASAIILLDRRLRERSDERPSPITLDPLREPLHWVFRLTLYVFLEPHPASSPTRNENTARGHALTVCANDGFRNRVSRIYPLQLMASALGRRLLTWCSTRSGE